MRHTRRALVGVLLGAVAVVGCGSSGSSAGSTTSSPATTTAKAAISTTTVEVQVDVLDDLVDPPGADGRTLSLVRYTIAPGAKLKPHVHPGVQMARVESGTLTYTVVSGVALVRRKGSTSDRPVTGPTTITLHAGDAVTEKGDMVHYGENRSDQVLVIVATLLTEDGRPLADPVTTTVPPR
jgi:quercetin dioxygenase-like cupin family protein